MSESDYQKLSREEKHYIDKVGDVYIQMQAPAKYMNHSCNPNAISENFSDIAIRDIKKGEEILVNYLQTLPDDMQFTCHCGSNDCVSKNMKTKITKQKKLQKPKDYLVVGLGILGVLYMLNFGFGVIEILPDNLPFIGNMDEAAALFLIYSATDYFGWDLKGFFKKKKDIV